MKRINETDNHRNSKITKLPFILPFITLGYEYFQVRYHSLTFSMLGNKFEQAFSNILMFPRKQFSTYGKEFP